MAGKNKNKKKMDYQSGAASLPQQDKNKHGGARAEGVRGVPAPAPAPAPAAPTPAALVMECEICSEKFDTRGRKPRNLWCGHSFCTTCCKRLIQQVKIICPKCRQETRLKYIEDLPVNYPVLEIIQSSGSDDTVAGQSKKREEQTSSPHGGKCLEARALIHMHCAYCQMWLCKDCSRIDHKGPHHLLTPAWDNLKGLHQVGVAKVKSTGDAMREFSREAKAYDDKLRSVATIMEITLDCVKREQDRLAGLRDRSEKMEPEILDVGKKTIPSEVGEVLLFLNGMDVATKMMQTWVTDASALLKGEQVVKLSKTLMQTAVQMHMDHNTQQANGGVLALHNIKGVDVTFLMEMHRGRLLVHAPDANNGGPQAGCRVVKFEHIKSCIDPSCALTFLDISLRGHKIGRVFIRLLGCTKRSQCFLMMCTGEAGPSFLNTRFHRLWWSRLPGEHGWAGDYDCGDGSGGKIPTEILQETMALSEKKTTEDITQGLVAGRYGEANSTIFRVYTKSSDAVEEAAFGRVENGFHVLRDALEDNKSITDITISGCGVVVEA